MIDERIKETLLVSNWESRCGNCLKPAVPTELSHKTRIGYVVADHGKGCGVIWKYITSEYGRDDVVRQMRPDLEVI